jgi:hypothetical protein
MTRLIQSSTGLKAGLATGFLTLTGLKTPVGLIDDIDTTFASHNAAIPVAVLQ